MLTIKRDIQEEVSIILSPNFRIDVNNTNNIPHSNDSMITFPNLDERFQATKMIETTVLYVDMRRSTQLSLKHRKHTVAKLYSAFVRSMARCAAYFNGEVRGIIGDRVMIIFPPESCFENAVDAAVLINSVCQRIINKHFAYNEVRFGIGIDFGRMLATKTGIRRRGSAQQSYRSLVWLGRPANVASKLTDNANKPEEAFDAKIVRVAYDYGNGLVYSEEWPHLFFQNFTFNPYNGFMYHSSPAFHSFSSVKKRIVVKNATPPILMTKRVYDGFRSVRPKAEELQNSWFYAINLDIPEYDGQAYGGDIMFNAFDM